MGLNPPLRIGLTGGIGSGKSTVAAMLARHGSGIVDTDAIARALTAPGGAALPALAQEFGQEILGPDGALDRDRMRRLAFGNATDKRRLETVLHPMIGQEATRQANDLRSQCVVFDVPLLTESTHWRARVDRVLVIDCQVQTQILRVRQRSGWDETMAQRVVAQQASREQRRAIADAVIHNDDRTTLDDLALSVGRLWQAWCEPG